MYIKCVILRLFSGLSRRVGALQISIIIIIIIIITIITIIIVVTVLCWQILSRAGKHEVYSRW